MTQIDAWRGEFGNAYTDRMTGSEQSDAGRMELWRKIIDLSKPHSILEVGSNLGLNLRTIRKISEAKLFALEPNEKARSILVSDGIVEPGNAIGGTAAKIALPDEAAELAFTAGVLIHVPPSDLLASCSEIYRCASKYVACIEYFSDKEESVSYRGRDDLLFKRDFGSFWLDNFKLELIDYGFFWRRASGLDNVTWWLFRKPA